MPENNLLEVKTYNELIEKLKILGVTPKEAYSLAFKSRFNFDKRHFWTMYNYFYPNETWDSFLEGMNAINKRERKSENWFSAKLASLYVCYFIDKAGGKKANAIVKEPTITIHKFLIFSLRDSEIIHIKIAPAETDKSLDKD